MPEEPTRKTFTKRPLLLYALLAVGGLLAAGFFVEACDSEKVEVCDTTTEKCEYSSSCRPLLVDLLR